MERFGARLKKIREQRGITLDQISLSTKIGVRFLRALEDEHFEQLPGGIFNKGFVRSYARMIGTDEEQAIADYLEASGEGQPKPPNEIAASLVQRGAAAGPGKEVSLDGLPRHGLTIALVIVVGVLALVFLGIHFRLFNPGGGSGVSGKDKASSPVLSSEPAQNTIGANGHVSQASQLRAPSSAPAAIMVKIKANDDSWLLITADGKPVMQDTLAAQEEKSVAAGKEIVIKAGNVGGVDFWFNGRKLASQGEYGNVKTLTFDRNGLRQGHRTRSQSRE